MVRRSKLMRQGTMCKTDVTCAGHSLNVSIIKLGPVEEDPRGVVKHPETISTRAVRLPSPHAKDPRRRGRIDRALHRAGKLSPIVLQPDSCSGHESHTARPVQIAIGAVELDNEIVNDLNPISDSIDASPLTRSSDASCRNAATTFLG